MESIKHSPHTLQKLVNEKLERGAMVVTIKLGESIELSNGVTIIPKSKSGKVLQFVIIAPQEVIIYRANSKQVTETVDE